MVIPKMDKLTCTFPNVQYTIWKWQKTSTKTLIIFLSLKLQYRDSMDKISVQQCQKSPRLHLLTSVFPNPRPNLHRPPPPFKNTPSSHLCCCFVESWLLLKKIRSRVEGWNWDDDCYLNFLLLRHSCSNFKCKLLKSANLLQSAS